MPTTAKSSRRERNIKFVESQHPEFKGSCAVMPHMSDAAKSGQIVYSADKPCCSSVNKNQHRQSPSRGFSYSSGHIGGIL